MKSDRSENLLKEIDTTIKNIEDFKIQKASIPRYLKEIDTTIKNIENFKTNDAKENSYLAQFLVVFISGCYEEIIEDTITLWAQSKSDRRISGYLSKQIYEKFRNPSTDNIIDLLERFDSEWSKEIKKRAEIEKASLNNIVVNKNSLAHGATTNATLKDVKRWHESARKIIEKIDEIIFP